VSAPTATPWLAGPWPEPFTVSWMDDTGSTNADLLAAAREGSPHGTVLVADHQHAGRGRMGRTWSAPPRTALLCSVLLRPPRGAVLSGAVWAVGLAAHAAVRELAGVDAELKWPNDLMVGERKLAGILAESLVGRAGGTGDAVVVGIGLNVDWSVSAEPVPADVAARVATLAELSGTTVDRAELLSALLTRLAPLLDEWMADPAALRARYRQELATLGRRVRVTLNDRALEGEAVDLTPDGALVVVADEGERCVVAAGDLVHLRPA
jgi:BirA family transcriptional regulator, biotin operon repressor / biotin---[acetyl-CoA-carboxylase] ligase